MGKKPKVSVIMTVYNTEAFVADALRSIMKQKLKEIEIIVINDGSTDRSTKIIQQLGETDSRIRIFFQENKGISISRNKGLELACGQYIYFMDSDDLLDPKALQNCYEIAEQRKLDVVCFDAEVFGDQKLWDHHFTYDRAKLVKDQIYSGDELLHLLLEEHQYRASVCLHLIRHSFLRQIKLSFYPGIIHEDELFSGILYIMAKRVGYIPKKYFKRRIRANSTMTRRNSFYNIYSYLVVTRELIKHKLHNKSLITKLVVYILNSSLYNARNLDFICRIQVIRICFKESLFQYIEPKIVLILLFPCTVTIKSYIKQIKWFH